MTSYGDRLKVAPYAIESIAQGTKRPRRMILWVDNPSFDPNSIPMLRRLVARGLEVRHTENYGPNTKWYPYASGEAGGEIGPMVVSDDDIMYDRQWLAGLAREYSTLDTETVIGYRGYSMGVTEGGEVSPYAQWPQSDETAEPSHKIFLTAVAGIILTPSLLSEMVSRGTDFMRTTPRADDIWINICAVRAGLRRRIIPGAHIKCLTFPRTQDGALHHENVGGGGNDRQMKAALEPSDIEMIRQG